MLNLSAAQAAVRALITTSGTESVALTEALDRVCAVSVRCRRPIPYFSAAAMDGFALGPVKGKEGRYIIKAETAAGDTTCRSLRAGEAVRITTGALLPAGTERVLPLEVSREEDNVLFAASPRPGKKFIQRRGEELGQGRVIIRNGERVNTAHLLHLNTDGQQNILVYKAPRAAFFCTGSELTTELRPAAGRRRSVNNLLLAALIRRAGAIPHDLGLASDTPEALRAALRRGIGGQRPAILISTGGMGPGKYDLTAAVFREMGGKVVFDHLSLRPGKGSLCGRLDNLLYFALPGPPAAVNTIFPLLISPALRQAQGLKKAWPSRMTATLRTEVKIRKPEFTHLKGGVLSYKGGRLMVREARILEEAGVVMVIPARRRLLRAGQLVGIFST